MATEIERYEKERFTSYECYYGVDIDYDHEKKIYEACVWSEKLNKNVELEDGSPIFIRAQLKNILIDNFHISLTKIQSHFNHTADFNNPHQNLENLRVAAKKMIAGAALSGR